MRIYQAPTVASTGTANASVEFSSFPKYIQDAFLTGMKNFGVFDNKPTTIPVKKVRLPRGFELYKFTGWDFKNPRTGKITDWWSPVEPYENDPGLQQRLNLAKCLGAKPSDLSGVYAAVREEWNALDHIMKATLKRDVYAFFGQCAMQPRRTIDDKTGDLIPAQAHRVWDPTAKRVHAPTKNLPGYASQFYIPNLTDADIMETEKVRTA